MRSSPRLVPPIAARRNVDAAPLIETLVSLIADAVVDRLAEQAAERTPEPTSPRLLDRRGLAEMLTCCTDTVDRLRAEGMPTVLVSEAIRFEGGACLEWLRQRGTK